MNNYSAYGAGSPITFLDTVDTNMDADMNHSSYLDDNHQLRIPHQPMAYGPSPAGKSMTLGASDSAYLTANTEYSNDCTGHWPVESVAYSQPTRPHHLSSSSQSSGYSSFRSSGNSFLSDPQNRFSGVSSISSWSNSSTQSTDPYLPQAEQSLIAHLSAPPSYPASPIKEPSPQCSRRRATQRSSTQGKDYYTTCVSRKQRARRSETVQRYFCTACGEGFSLKADWKRHEETFQERPEEYQCDFCYAKYFLDKDFATHHEKSHGCLPCSGNTKCSEKRHVRMARKQRTVRSGWGCGFCNHFTTNWTDRCNHIAFHFEEERKTMRDWKHSVVILSLIHRPAIFCEWEKILRSERRVFVSFWWDSACTSRVEGYPDSNKTLQLQDALEYFSPGQNATAVARWAYEQATKKIARGRLQSPEAPPVPPKDHRINRKASLQEITKETESMTQFIQSIIADDILPTGVTFLEHGSLDDASSLLLDTIH
jgi:hypothetical protein